VGTRSFVAILIGIPYYNVPEYFWQAVGLVPGYIYVPQGLPDQVIERQESRHMRMWYLTG